MNWKDPHLDERLKHFIDALRPVPARNLDAAERGRANFLKQAEELRTAPARTRRSLFQLKGLNPARNFLFASLLTLGIFFAGTGATVYAAQGSLPGDGLYPLKTISEDAVLALTPSAQDRLKLVLGFSDRRVSELSRLQALGKTIPPGITERLNSESDQALVLAAGMDDKAMNAALVQIMDTAASQSKIMSDLLARDPQDKSLQKALKRSQQQANIRLMDHGSLHNFPQMLLQNPMSATPASAQSAFGTPDNSKADHAPGNPKTTPGPAGAVGGSQDNGNGKNNPQDNPQSIPKGSPQGGHQPPGLPGTQASDLYSTSPTLLPGAETYTPTPTPTLTSTPKSHGAGARSTNQVP